MIVPELRVTGVSRSYVIGRYKLEHRFLTWGLREFTGQKKGK